MSPAGTAWKAASFVVLLLLWALAAALAQSRYLPGPGAVWPVFVDDLTSGTLVRHLLATLARVAGAFVIAMALGTAIGLALGRSPRANRFFDPWLILALNIPALVTIVFCYLWIGINEVAAITAVAINKIPNVAVTIREGAKALDPALDDVARVFRFPWTKRLTAVIWPQLEPYFAATVRSGLALIWKIVLVVELLGRSNGVGFQINLYFQLFDLTQIIVYALSFMAIVSLIESVLVKPWELRARTWRGET